MDNRAKQFVPFAAVKGYEEALRAKEKDIAEKNSSASPVQYDMISTKYTSTFKKTKGV